MGGGGWISNSYIQLREPDLSEYNHYLAAQLSQCKNNIFIIFPRKEDAKVTIFFAVVFAKPLSLELFRFVLFNIIRRYKIRR
jgi:hypothetical protein